MRSRDYTKEIGLLPAEQPVPIAATTALFVAAVVLAMLFARQLNGLKPVRAETTDPSGAINVSSR